MEIKSNKNKSLYQLFLNYLIIFCVLTVLLGLLLVSMFTVGLNSGVLLPANYGQNHIEEIKNDILSREGVNQCHVTHPYSFGLMDEQQQLIRSNFNQREAVAALNYLNNVPSKTQLFFSTINLDEGMCVIAYDMLAHFSSAKIDRFIPYPEYVLMILFLLLFSIMTSTIVIKFGKKLKRELNPLLRATYRIMNQDLDFEISPTNIKEYNDVLFSISKMKEALKQSLETQWKAEQLKKEQIAALAHDVKTPLTIISGNAQLLVESEISDEDKEFLNYIIKNADKIETYMTQLLEVTRGEQLLEAEFDLIQADQFFKEVAEEASMMGQSKNIKSNLIIKKPIDHFYGNKELLIRAITNIVNNAIDHSPEDSQIDMMVDANDQFLIFKVVDCGIGFTDNGLIYATDQFYMEQAERKGGSHYGMGLYIAQTIAIKHGGIIKLKNREDDQGAEVSLIIKIDKT